MAWLTRKARSFPYYHAEFGRFAPQGVHGHNHTTKKLGEGCWDRLWDSESA